MSVEEARAETAPEAETAIAPLRLRRLVVAAVSGAILALIALILMLRLDDDGGPPAIESREDPVADLLAWIPADDVTRAAFSVWTPDTGLATPAASSESADLADRLNFDPSPRVLGRTPDWGEQYGWSAVQVTSWAVAGADGDLTVLDGQFDEETIRERLSRGGYSRENYRGVDIYAPGEASDQSMAIAPLAGRLIVSVSTYRLRQAIDVVIDGEGSLADEPAIATMLRSMAPLSALVAADRIQHAAHCAPDIVAADQPLSGNYVVVGYGRLGPGQERRTLVATSFADETAATAALSSYDNGWNSGFANAGGMGGRIEAFGDLTVVSRTANLLIAELVNGRDDGWVRSGIRYAIPVCEAAMAIAQPATPAPGIATEPVSTIERLVGSLPATGASGVFRAVDVSGIESARGLSEPDPDLAADHIASWVSDLAPLPAFAIAPLSPDALTAWSDAFDAPFSAIDGVAESQYDVQSEPIGVLIGDWDLEVLTVTLQSQGYQWINRGDVRHFAPRPNRTPRPLMAGAGGAWENIAVLGDRIWFSADQRAMRAAIDEVTGRGAPEGGAMSGQVLLGATGEATALEMSGVEYLARHGCGAILRGVAAIGAVWTASAAGESAAIAYLPDGTVAESGLMDALDSHVTTMTLSLSADGAASPAPALTVSLAETLGYLGTESASSTAGVAIVARFSAPAWERIAGLGFFEGTSSGCALTRVD